MQRKSDSNYWKTVLLQHKRVESTISASLVLKRATSRPFTNTYTDS